MQSPRLAYVARHGAQKSDGAKDLGVGACALEDLSISADSGWREEDQLRIDQLVEMIKDREILNLESNIYVMIFNEILIF